MISDAYMNVNCDPFFRGHKLVVMTLQDEVREKFAEVSLI